MLRILIRHSFRSLIKQMPYSFVNILGLTVGISSVILLIIWISVETSYEKFLKDHDRIFRVGMVIKTPNSEINSGSINAPAGPEYKRAFPMVEETVRFLPVKQAIKYNDKFTSLNIYYSDSTFFKLFSFGLVSGDRVTCLNAPESMVLTESTAKKIFGNEDPLNKTISIAGTTFIVTAIAKDPPVNTNMRFDGLASLKVIEKTRHVGWDGGLTCYTYLRLVSEANLEKLNIQVHDYMEDAVNKEWKSYGYAMIPYLKNICDIHLNSDAVDEIGEKGSRSQVLVFSGIGLLILLIACFNFVNISTAISFRRAKEVSVKKIFGSDRKKIVLSFISESATAILIGLFSAFLIAKVLLPLTSSITGKTLDLTAIGPFGWVLIFISLFVFCTVFASSYSSIYLSAGSPHTLMNAMNRGLKRQLSRNILVTIQYTISIILVICSLVIFSQMQFIKKTDKGFNEKNLLSVALNPLISENYGMIRDRFAMIPGVVAATVSAGGTPGIEFTGNGYIAEGTEKPIMAKAVYIDENYFRTMEISILDGRNFRDLKSDPNKVVINKRFAEFLNWDKPVGMHISRNNTKYEVIGVVNNFNTSTFRNSTEPLFISTDNEWGSFDNVIIRYEPSSLNTILNSCRSILKEIAPESPFEYQFIENAISEAYARERKLNILFVILSVIAIFISSLGLFGLATFSTQSRMKEIGIRKINGASITEIFRKFNSELIKWILLAFLIAGPIGYYIMAEWLDNFAYKTKINPGILIFSLSFTLLIGILTVSWAANRAARTNPAESLRND